MDTIESVAEIQERTRKLRAEGRSIGFVPTMGFLHAGHRSLMRTARERADQVVVSIFVNPLQFGPTEDLARYPRDPEGDARQCSEEGVDLLFMPASFYLPDHATKVQVERLTTGLCGASRPGHFDGVTTVVARLFGLVHPTFAVFGEKDFQQLAVIRKMVADLAMDLEIVGAPLVRDTDGLALSSRNKYLSPEDRTRALTLHRALFAMRDRLRTDGKGADLEPAKRIGRALLDADRIDYLEIVDADTLAEPTADTRSLRALVAAFFGTTRLIDNVGLDL
jgi:pantoate--beta-alanine ligase